MAKKATKKAASAAEAAGLIDQSRYERTTFTDPKTGKTRHSASNGDAVAIAMMHIPAEKLDAVVRVNKLEMKPEYPNSGMYRMAVGNKLRAMVRAHENDKAANPSAKIGEFEIKSLAQRVPAPSGDKKTAQAAKKATKAKKNAAETQAAM